MPFSQVSASSVSAVSISTSWNPVSNLLQHRVEQHAVTGHPSAFWVHLQQDNALEFLERGMSGFSLPLLGSPNSMKSTRVNCGL